jgi:hypothetical protein
MPAGPTPNASLPKALCKNCILSMQQLQLSQYSVTNYTITPRWLDLRYLQSNLNQQLTDEPTDFLRNTPTIQLNAMPGTRRSAQSLTGHCDRTADHSVAKYTNKFFKSHT